MKIIDKILQKLKGGNNEMTNEREKVEELAKKYSDGIIAHKEYLKQTTNVNE